MGGKKLGSQEAFDSLGNRALASSQPEGAGEQAWASPTAPTPPEWGFVVQEGASLGEVVLDTYSSPSWA